MTKNQKIWTVVVILVIAGLICWRFSGLRQNSANGITIGVAVGETGDAAEWGREEYNIFKMYVGDVNAQGGVNGSQIKLDVEDTKSAGEGTVTAVTKLINVDQVPVILGPTWADSFQGGNPIAENAKTVLLTPSAALEVVDNKQNFTYLFSTWWPQAPEIRTMQSYMVAHGIKSVAIVNDQDTFTTKFSDSLAASLSAAGINVPDREQIAIGQNDFRTEILKIKNFHPDAVFVEMSNIGGLGPFMKEVKELGLTAAIFSTPDAQSQDLLDKFGTVMEGMTYPFARVPTSTLYQNFVAEYQAKYNNELPSGPSDVNAYNAVASLVAVLKDGARTGTEIRDALYKVSTPGIGVQDISFNALGQINQANFEMKMIHGGQFVTITN